MNRPVLFTFLVAALAAFVGCNGGSVPSPAQSIARGQAGARHEACRGVRRAARPAHRATPATYPTNSPLIFDADLYNDDVQIYEAGKVKANPKPIVTFVTETGYPDGVAMDSHGSLYVADECGGGSGNASDVEEFAKGQTTNPTILTAGISAPAGLALDAKNTLYVSNYPAAITVYAYGSSTPEKTITGNGMVDPCGLAVDKAGNLYVADAGADQVFELLKGSSTLTALNLEDLKEPFGVAIDQTNGYLWVTDGKLEQVNVYKLGSTGPSEEISGFTYPAAVGLQNRGYPKATAIVGDLDKHAVFAYKALTYSSYATLTNGIEGPAALLIATP